MSSTWSLKDLYGLGYESNLGYQGTEYNGTYGYDTLGIQGKGANVSVDHQVIAAIENKKFFVGNLGLSPYQINFTSSTDSSPSLLASLKNKNLIPGLSYGYTAGASYRKKQTITERVLRLIHPRTKERCHWKLDLRWLRCVKIRSQRRIFQLCTYRKKTTCCRLTVYQLFIVEKRDTTPV